MSFRPTLKLAGLLTLAFLTVGCQQKAADDVATSPKSSPPAADAAWQALADEFIEGYFSRQPFFAVKAGRHEFDGKMPDWSAAGIQKNAAWLKEQRERVASFSTAALTPAQKVERDHLLAAMDGDVFWLDRARSPFKNPAWYVGNLDPSVYLSREYAPLPRRLAAYVGYAESIPAVAANIRANLEMPMPRSLLERGIAGFGGYAEFFRNDVPKVFAEVKDEQLMARFATANEAAAKAMEGLETWLESERKNANENFALGPTLFAEMLEQTERVDVPLEELRRIARADLDRNLAALKEACGQYLAKAPLRVCIDAMSAKKPEGGAVAGARAQLESLRAFVVEKRLATIPGTEEARVEESPPYNRGNAAYIDIPGPYEKGLPSIYYIAPPDPNWSAAERAAYVPGDASLLFITAHEVWPGHFLQFLHANRNPSKVHALWIGYAYAEGWAHYTEEMMWDAGLGSGDPETHIGQLTNALLRNVRFLSAIGLHTEGMTLRQSEQMFRDSAFQDPGNARQQAARGTYDPGYLNYTLGKLMIRKLREDWLAQQPPASDPRLRWGEFHDRFLAFGGPPIPVVRREMVGEGGSLF
jgi:hypothetical protein